MKDKTYFFCGIGGSGMLPLAVLLRKMGALVVGSDRCHDDGKMPQKFAALKGLGIEIVAQDGRGVDNRIDMLVVSSAVESRIPDVQEAIKRDIPIIKRGALLAEYFNNSQCRVAVAGTSGKSTVTGMIATILDELSLDPTVVNGGEIRNFCVGENDRFSGVRYGGGHIFVAEMDESDGSIAHYNPSIAVLNNIALDHKTMEELNLLFGAYLARTDDFIVVNFDQDRVRDLCSRYAVVQALSYAIDYEGADLRAVELTPRADGIDFVLQHDGNRYDVSLNVPGRHNVENAMAALSVCVSLELDVKLCIHALSVFRGIHRRMELVGHKNDITVLDDFAHNPDKISASLQCLKEFDGRLIVMFQMHGFGPLRLFRHELAFAFSRHLGAEDILVMPEVYYAGGTVDRSVTAKDFISDLSSKDIDAHWFARRDDVSDFIIQNARAGDRIVIMGARDDTLHVFAHEILDSL